MNADSVMDFMLQANECFPASSTYTVDGTVDARCYGQHLNLLVNDAFLQGLKINRNPICGSGTLRFFHGHKRGPRADSPSASESDEDMETSKTGEDQPRDEAMETEDHGQPSKELLALASAEASAEAPEASRGGADKS